ncbi:MAG: cell wall hydrolase [Pseudomonadota bacterium]
MLRRVLKRNFTQVTVTSALALAVALPFTGDVAHQDISELTGRNTNDGRWLATLISEPGKHVYDPDHQSPPKWAPVILKVATNTRLSVLDRHINADFVGYGFAATPEVAAKLSAKTIVSRAGKGDLPVSTLKARAAGPLVAGSLYDTPMAFSAPSDSVWPRLALVSERKTTQFAATKADRPAKKAVVAQKQERLGKPLALIPKAKIAEIERETLAKVEAGEIDLTTTASTIETDKVAYGYASVTSNADPRDIFNAVIASRTEREPEIDTDPSLGTTSALGLPFPKVNPRASTRTASLEVPRTQRKNHHFWSGFSLPRSSFKKKQQRCLAAGIYFESRGEPEEGQAAVAQVILNRVKNPTYPNTICGVVYQNKHWRNRCQFSFACDGIYDRVNDKGAWKRAVRIARDVTKGRTYLPKVGDSTHYHATYVSPRWARKMKIVDKIGVHIFYRTKRGGWS